MFLSPLRRRPSIFARRHLLTLLAIAALGLAASQHYTTVTEAAATDLFFSEYIEGTSNNKALEIYNGTAGPVNLATANYVMQVYSNGATTPNATTALTGTIASGDVFVIANSSASATILAQADQTSGNVNYNGDDAVVLRKGGATGTIVDVIGQIGFDPGTEWGTGNTSTADNTIRRKSTICAGDTNGSDAFDPATEWDGFATDDFSGLGSHTSSCGASDVAPTVTSTTPANGATGVAVNSNISITFSEPVNVSGSSFTISCGTSGAHAFALSGSSATYTLDPTVDFANSETCTVTVLAAQVTDQDSIDPPDNMASNYSFSFTTVVSAGACGDPYTHIYEIQGSGASSPINNTDVVTEGIVTGDFQTANQQSGFYIQDAAGDGNTATSDGIFVFAPGSTDVNVGDRVRVFGRVTEFNTMTELGNVTTVAVCATAATVPPPTAVDLPEPTLDFLERYEGMLVTFPEALSVTGNNLQGRFGEVMLSSDGRLFQPNNFNRPNSAGALATAELNARRQILLDDGQSIQNPNPIPYIGADNTLRAGDTVSGLTGVIDYGLSTTNGTTRDYRVQPTAAVNFVRSNPRPAAPAPVGGTLRAAFSNVLNYFNGDGAGGGFPTARGASTAAEFARQRAKIIAAITTMNADVIGISEMENDGNGAQSAMQDLVNGLNDATAPGTYVGIDSPNPGTDLIKNIIIYKPASLTPVGAQVNDVDPAWDQARPPLAQTFQQNSNGEKFTYIANHFTSKSCSSNDTGADADQGDGQGCDNFQRTQQAQRLLVFIQQRKTASGDPDVLSMGDYNAYGEEDPLFILEQDSSDTLADGPGGLVSEAKRFVATADRYSFQFDAMFGDLDHGLATKSLDSQITGATIWHINADEPTVIDYNTEFKTQDLYTPTPYRASDHDPLVIGLKLGPPVLPGQVIISEFRWSGPAGDNDEFIELYNTTNLDITVQSSDGSSGWAVAADDATGIRYVIPNGTVIPARRHFLIVNNNASGGYSLSGYPSGNNGQSATFATPDTTSTGAATYTTDIPRNTGIALFRTSTPANFSTGVGGTRLDAVGVNATASGGVDPCSGAALTSSSALYREGAGLYPYGTRSGAELQYSFVRNLSSGAPQDTDNNAADFWFLDTSLETGACVYPSKILGAPGPENTTSMRNYTGSIPGFRIDSTQAESAAPNRVRAAGSYNDTLTPSGPNGVGTPYTLGTLSIRRRFTNPTGHAITRLRFRVVDITTFPRVGASADVRALTSPTLTATTNDGSVCAVDPTATSTSAPCDVTVRGLTLEQPPTQPNGGGLNSTLSAGTIDLASPLPNGASINVNFLLGVAQSGGYRFFIIVEAIP